MNFILVSTGPYPDTNAAAIRHTVLAKGLVELGHNVNFLLLSPQNLENKNAFNYFAVTFHKLNSYQGKNKLILKIYNLWSVFKAKKIIQQQHREKNIDAIIIYTIELLPIYFIVKQAHILKLKVFHERTELPYIFNTKKILLGFYLRKLLPMFDGIFVISDKLSDFIHQFNTSTQKLLTVVDLKFFSINKPSLFPFPYLGYCGTISGNKDGVPILIEAFARIANKYPDLKLVLVGNNKNKADIKETLEAIKSLGLEEKVIFTGLVDRALIPIILCNARILVVSKPDNEQNSGNFPIKIGEYLATGLPIVVTNVGEIGKFIKDGESCFLAIPGSVESFAGKMDEALSNPARSKTIGENGKRIAETTFDYRKQAQIMTDYITKIKQQL